MTRYYSEKNPQNFHGIWVQNLIKKNFCIQKEKNCKIIMAHECQIWYLVARLYIKRNKDFFGSPLKTFLLEIVEVIEKLEEIKKNIRTWDCGNMRHNSALWREVTHFFFSAEQIFCGKLLYYIAAMIVLKHFCLVTHCCAASFSIKTLFCKTNLIFYSLRN